MQKKFYQPEAETMPVNEIKKLQEYKLIRQVRYVYENVEYYRNLMDEKGVKPEDITCLEDISKLPFLDFLRMPISYRTVYNFMGTTQALASQGSTLNSATQMQASLTGQMQTLYNRFPFIKNAYKQKTVTQPKDPKRMSKKEKEKAMQDSIGVSPCNSPTMPARYCLDTWVRPEFLVWTRGMAGSQDRHLWRAITTAWWSA